MRLMKRLDVLSGLSRIIKSLFVVSLNLIETLALFMDSLENLILHLTQILLGFKELVNLLFFQICVGGTIRDLSLIHI